MKIYVINLTVNTKTTDLYDQVAINKYPVIVFCNDEKELWEKLSSKENIIWVRQNVKTRRLFDTAYYHIREIFNGEVKDICWKLDSIISIDYKNVIE